MDLHRESLAGRELIAYPLVRGNGFSGRTGEWRSFWGMIGRLLRGLDEKLAVRGPSGSAFQLPGAVGGLPL